MRMVALGILAAIIAHGAALNLATAGPRPHLQPVVGTTTELPQRPGCTMVELRPGYPGYRGNVTGVMPHEGGTGDYDCLETLQQLDPMFNRERQDRLNELAATALGIQGPPELWVWENWMQIEAERGFTPSCYTCLMVEEAGPAYSSGVRANFNDYRNMVGFMGDTTVINVAALRHGIPALNQHAVLDWFRHDDYVLRAIAFAWAGPTANATQLLEAIDIVMEEYLLPNGRFFDYRHIGTVIYQWGGYAYTPRNADPLDQLGTIYYGVLAAQGIPGQMQQGIMAALEMDADGWYAVLHTTSPPYPSFAEYLQQQSTWQRYRP